MHSFHFGSQEENVGRACDLKFIFEKSWKSMKWECEMLKQTVGLQTTRRAEWRQMYKMPLLPPLTNLTDCCSFVMTLWNKLILYSSCITDWLFRLMIKSFYFFLKCTQVHVLENVPSCCTAGFFFFFRSIIVPKFVWRMYPHWASHRSPSLHHKQKKKTQPYDIKAW